MQIKLDRKLYEHENKLLKNKIKPNEYHKEIKVENNTTIINIYTINPLTKEISK